MRRKAKFSPLILIAPGTSQKGEEFFDYSVSLSDAYPCAIAAAGGVPWILPCTPSPEMLSECVRRADGVLLTGGDDIEPSLYRDRLTPALRKTLSPADAIRDANEMRLIRETFAQAKPLLAICRGHQMLQVTFGGELIVDIPTEMPKALDHCQMALKDDVAHQVELVPNSLLTEVFGQGLLGVNSTHHQAVRTVVRPLRVTGRSSDGLIEAMELDLADRHLLPYLLAVQFHPERLIRRYPEFLELFRSFTRACVSGR